MNGARDIQNLALVGFMGVGKSTIGRLVAEALRFSFLDTDAWIEERTGKTIPRIFEEEGEAGFRQYEKLAVKEWSGQRGLVLSTGGGLVLDRENMEGLKAHGLVVWLCASPEVIWERVRTQTHRPLLQTPDPQGKIKELLAARTPIYRQADVLLDSGLRPPREVALQIVHQFNLTRRQ